MANAYTQTYVSNEPTVTPTEVVRLYWCDVSAQLLSSDTINFSWTGAAAFCIDVFAFSNVATGAAASSATGHNVGNTSPFAGPLTAGSAGDLVLFNICTANSPTFSAPLDVTAGNAMTPLTVSPQTGQSRSAYTVYRAETAGATWSPKVTLGTSQEWACGSARWANNGSTAALIASSAATSGWQASATSGSVSPGTTIPVGSKLLLVFYGNAQSSAFALSDTGTSSPVNTVAPVVTSSSSLMWDQTLTTTNGTWTGDTSSGFTYQWKDGSGNIAGATSSTYRIAHAEVGQSIHCTVTATGTGGSTTADSNTVGPIYTFVPKILIYGS